MEVSGRTVREWTRSSKLHHRRQCVQTLFRWKSWKSAFQYKRRAAAHLQCCATHRVLHGLPGANVRWRHQCCLPDKSSAADPMPMNVLKQVIDLVSPFIFELFNHSLDTGHFPNVLRQVFITPVVKKVNLDVNDASSYRPISTLLVLSKVLEISSFVSWWTTWPPKTYCRHSSPVSEPITRPRLLSYGCCPTSSKLSTVETWLPWFF